MMTRAERIALHVGMQMGETKRLLAREGIALTVESATCPECGSERPVVLEETKVAEGGFVVYREGATRLVERAVSCFDCMVLGSEIHEVVHREGERVAGAPFSGTP